MSDETTGDQRQIRIAKLAKAARGRDQSVSGALRAHPPPRRGPPASRRFRADPGRRPHPDDAGHGQALVRDAPGRDGQVPGLGRRGRRRGRAFYRETWKKLVDLGDFIGVEGKTWVTKTGEPTCRATDGDVPREDAAAAAREVARHHRPRALPAAPLPRPRHEPRDDGPVPLPLAAHPDDARVPGVRGVRRGRDADPRDEGVGRARRGRSRAITTRSTSKSSSASRPRRT